MGKSPGIRVNIEVSYRLTRVFRIPPHWTPWILLLLCAVLVGHGLPAISHLSLFG